MLKGERQRYIIEKVNKYGRAVTSELTAELGVAEDTIRKDFQELSAKGLVKRIHGGVLKLESSVSDFNDRITQSTSEKKLLAAAAIELIHSSNVIYIDGGTTNLFFAESLPEHLEKVFITNSPAIALNLCRLNKSEVYIIGGKLDQKSKIIRGSRAVLDIQQINVECCILGVSSISITNGITFPSYSESVLKKELIANCREIIAIATKDKLDSIATFHSADISEIDHLVTDETDTNVLKKYEDKGINVISINL